MAAPRTTDAVPELQARALELERESHRDPLTGLHNQAWFDLQLAQAFGEACQTKTPLTLLMIDIDALHAINQAHGHAAGDKVIFSVAAGLKQRLRPRDLVARHAGAAFVVLLPFAASDAGRVVAERLRAGIAGVTHDVGIAQTLHVTVSIGCLSLERGGFATRHQLLEAAARALAVAKRNGRDQVAVLVDNRGEPLDRSAPAV